MSPRRAPAMVLRDFMVDENVLECSVCFLPLKPPIFQCVVGHVLCSPCSEKLKDARKCHACGVAMADGYRRCHAMEAVMNSIRRPCPYKPFGCGTTPAYHAFKEHRLRCPCSPYRCPGDDCGFVGSDFTTLVEHLSAAHGWPCTAEPRPCADSFPVNLRDGYNFLSAVRPFADCLFLLNMATTPFGHAISLAISSSEPWDTLSWRLKLTSQHKHPGRPHEHYQSRQFEFRCRPFNNIPDPNASFQFFIPKYAGGSYDEATVQITASISRIRVG